VGLGSGVAVAVAAGSVGVAMGVGVGPGALTSTAGLEVQAAISRATAAAIHAAVGFRTAAVSPRFTRR
jgi:hypothetical protein